MIWYDNVNTHLATLGYFNFAKPMDNALDTEVRLTCWFIVLIVRARWPSWCYSATASVLLPPVTCAYASFFCCSGCILKYRPTLNKFRQWYFDESDSTEESVYLLSSLCCDVDVELVSAVDWCRETSCVLIIRVAYVRHHSVEYNVGVLRDRSNVVRQTNEERDASSSRRRCSCGTWQ